MLDTDTKRRIDTARDILVGKVPDPKSQVEQITIALIYKFMDDMDRESVEMGGKRTFFTGDYERYSWSNIFNPRLGGHEMLNLYAEAITRMSQNPNLPELFRNIFKNAYLPYRDPETLKLFLKTINEFTYDHSERLGDAFEYLLSVLGSQGDAGQFRTPRHIIGFMVEIVSPKKNELILDPACGTAGFLISAYKYIMRENTSEKYRSSNGNGIGDLLTTEERKKLLTNFKGYDISPDMVRLSLVNMYLHGFVNPQIYEYDTLTSEDRWNEYADVILANPPFMTPKGGIKPHKRFSVQSNRSEVLFVDYIMEHLTPAGRAAVIVPEGIIFQSANAYKQLRKMLVENYLYAVVSLPAGVFQPYSGVKTSILLMDKVLAKKTDSILFVKIENDGFDLGAQRRPIDRNDLPDALQVIREYIEKVRNGKADEFNADEKPCSALLVKKEKLAENGEYNLTGDRYRVVEKRKHQKWPMVKLGEVLTISNIPDDEKNIYKRITVQLWNKGVCKREIKDELANKTEGTKYFKRKAGQFIYGKQNLVRGAFGVIPPELDGYCSSSDVPAFDVSERLNVFYLDYILRGKYKEFSIYEKGAGSKRVHEEDFLLFSIPLPPLEVQKEIVAEIEGYQKIIDGCRQVIEAWKPDVETYLDKELKTYLAEHPEKQEELASGWPMVKLGEEHLFQIESGGTPDSENEQYWNGEISWATLIDLPQEDYISIIKSTKRKITEVGLKNSSAKIIPANSVIVSTRATIGRVGINKIDLATNQGFKNIIIKDYKKVNVLYLAYSVKRLAKNMENLASGGTFKEISKTNFCTLQIVLPPLEIQSRIVDKIESERKIIDSLREMVKTYEEKIKRVIDRVWGE